MVDKLTEIFEKQGDLQAALGYTFDEMTDEERAGYIKEYALHTEHELHEMLAELPFFKAWKKYPKEGFREPMWNNSREEFVDALHFFVNMALALGFTATSLSEAYCKKNAINYDRQADTEQYKMCKERQDTV